MRRSCCNTECQPGLRGPRGLSGTPAFTPVFAYVYNTSTQVVNIDSPVIFNDIGILSTGILFIPGTSAITINVPGVYRIVYSVSGIEPNQFGILRNTVELLGSRYGAESDIVIHQNNGQVIARFFVGDIITLVNNTSLTPITLSTFIGGSRATVNASISLELVAP